MVGETIAAIATPPGQGGVAIVRLSGPASHAIVAGLLRRAGGTSLEPRRVYVGRLVERPGGRTLDQVLVFAMRGPHSYTGEDTAEIHCHGGSVLTRRILEAVLAAGARAAEPGEFTRRAFLNGRMDLAQAEAVGELIAARGDAALRLAWSQLEGQLSARVERLRDAVVGARALCEAAIDFPEDDVPEVEDGRLAHELGRVRGELEVLGATFERARVRFEGARVVLAGRPNVGKSSLLNVLAGRERAIVTPVAGTTRDVLEAAVVIGGVPAVVTDTAGIRDTDDPIERLGVERARAAIADAACVVAVFDRSVALERADELVATVLATRPAVAVLNKRDLPARMGAAQLRVLVGAVPIVEVSALTGEGLGDLESAVATILLGGEPVGDDEVVLFRVRHWEAVQRAAAELRRAEEALAARRPLDLIAADLAAAAASLGAITGAVTSEDVLDRVFAEFCIGK
ncbi:MAG TPA: tRNA uridine-5-carboxymethylaminomethyl(34) synthesis GTPase MnmE [Candidatus Binatia bacterium]